MWEKKKVNRKVCSFIVSDGGFVVLMMILVLKTTLGFALGANLKSIISLKNKILLSRQFSLKDVVFGLGITDI